MKPSFIVPLLMMATAAQPSAAASSKIRPSFSVMAEYDTNARRQAIDADLEADKPVGDGLVRARAGLRGSSGLFGGQLNVNTDVGLKRFVRERSQSMGVLQLQGSYVRPLPFDLNLTLNHFSRARGQLNGVRTFSLNRSEVGLARGLPYGFWAQASAIAVGFLSVDSLFFSSMQSGLRLDAANFITPFERIGLFAIAAVRGYPLLSAISESGPTAINRADAPLTLGATFSSTRALYLSVSYLFTRNWSNSFGEAYARHRLQAVMGVRLPFEFTLTGQAAVQLTSYDNGLSIGQRLLLADDDERQNNLTVALSRPFLWGISTEARFAVFGNEFARERVSFLRTTAGLGVRWAL